MTSTPLPLGAVAPDELLVAYVNGSLSPHERDAVERWLAVNPAYQRRVESLRAVRVAVRTAPPSVDSRPPPASELSGLWAAIDAAPAAARPAPAPPLPPPVTSLDDARRRRGRSRWFLAAAAALLVVVAGVVAALAIPGGGEQDRATPAPDTVGAAETPEPTSPGDAAVPGASNEDGTDDPAESDEEMRAALSRSAAATSQARTANVTFRAVADAELSVGPITLEMAGTGQVELPGRSVLDTRTTARSPDGEELLPPSTASVVEAGERTFVRCGGEAEYTERAPDAAECFTLALGPDVFGPDATIDMIEEAQEFDISKVGEESIGGVASTGYQVVEPVEVDGESVPLVVQIWIDEDSLIRRIVGAARYRSEETGLTALVISYELSDYGVPVDIPDLD